ncbi:SMP-30/gluconolactonase/LRE family protein (plasmid) [Rhizobium leguminosarum bv. viciae]|nr:SMP-30/gluconolactonase/LRE family protein [Rhizobium leguminosarum bv. viciae]
MTELAGGQLHKVSLSDPTTIAPFGSSVVYSFLGGGPDSLRIDADGNIYLAIYGQGRIMGSIPTGFPIGQYLLPGRDQGHNLRSTSMLIRPGTDELLILMTGTKEGSTIFAARALARAAQ